MDHIPQHLFQFATHTPGQTVTTAGKSRRSFAAAWHAFTRHTASVVALGVLGALLLFALIAPICIPYGIQFRDGYYRNALPKYTPLAFLGWDGCQKVTVNQASYDYYTATGAVKQVLQRHRDEQGRSSYRIRLDSYEKVGWVYVDLSEAEFAALRDWEASSGIPVCAPLPSHYATTFLAVPGDANLWYTLADDSAGSTGLADAHDAKGDPIFTPRYLLDDAGNPVYGVKNQTGIRCRVRYSAYYQYRNGFPPRYLFGTNQHGQDILLCLAYGARVSFLLAIAVSVLNFCIGVPYGAVGGFYGGKVDLMLGRISDILAAVPFIVVATLFQLHLVQRIGAIPVLLLSFLLTGWIGIANRVRSQFYRFKGAEYVLAAKTLGARDPRLIFRHILPNCIGTIITGTVLLIPGVIFSESMLSYLGIVNLESAGLTSIGTMLSGGQAYLGSFPHILLFPAALIALLQIAFNLFGNGLRDAFDPRNQGR